MDGSLNNKTFPVSVIGYFDEWLIVRKCMNVHLNSYFIYLFIFVEEMICHLVRS